MGFVGPRSTMRTMTRRPFARLVTRSTVSNGYVGCAATIAVLSNFTRLGSLEYETDRGRFLHAASSAIGGDSPECRATPAVCRGRRLADRRDITTAPRLCCRCVDPRVVEAQQ